ncbi:MAG: SpoVA/SpoVAEb family sporulation membrane protein [Lachnospiraceae bacterium]|jgi:stage V sporulation protein AC|nr:SpoVA/SpoVAEb family sporulation membrane protein [Lachnospiraceae bacterium]
MDKKIRNKEYNEMVKAATPTHNLPANMAKAFVVGGLICVLGQAIFNYMLSMGIAEKDAYGYTGVVLIFLSVVLTGLNIYPSLATFGGAGALVPITGFANGVASCAIEFKPEGQVFGIGCKIFTIAGPVILYGIVVSAAMGVIYYFW